MPSVFFGVEVRKDLTPCRLVSASRSFEGKCTFIFKALRAKQDSYWILQDTALLINVGKKLTQRYSVTAQRTCILSNTCGNAKCCVRFRDVLWGYTTCRRTGSYSCIYLNISSTKLLDGFCFNRDIKSLQKTALNVTTKEKLGSEFSASNVLLRLFPKLGLN